MYSTSVMVNANGGSMRKGFTLIELLAVIIVLAVIALIATPIVLDVVDSAKLKAFEESAYGIIETVKLKNYDDVFEGNSNNKTYIFPNDELVFQGERPKGGSVVSVNGEIILAINNGKYCATKKLGDEKVTITENLENCDIKYVNLNGTITETNPIIAKVQLVKNDKVIYETTSDENGHYEFNDVVSDNYLLLISQKGKTKHGEEINLTENTIKNMAVVLASGDVNDDNIINDLDKNIVSVCYGKIIANNPECINADIDGNGEVGLTDLSVVQTNYNKISNILYLQSFNLSGKVSDNGTKKPIVSLYNGQNAYDVNINDEGTFNLEKIPQGFYFISVVNPGYLKYTKTEIYRENVNINIKLYPGDVNGDNEIDDDDIKAIQNAIEKGYDGSLSRYMRFDLNDDGVIDQRDIDVARANIGKTYEY